MEAKQYPHTYITRSSIFILLLKTLSVEILLELINLAPRILLGIIAPSVVVTHNFHTLSTLLFIALTVIQIGILIYLFLEWENHYYEITSTEIITWSGILRKSKQTASFVHLESVSVQQSILGRLCNYGTVNLYIPTQRKELYLLNVPRPYEVTNYIKEELPKQDAKAFFMRK